MRYFSFHQTKEIHLVPDPKDPQGIFLIRSFFYIKIVIQGDTVFLYITPVGLRDFLIRAEIAVLHVKFGEAFIIGNDHTAVRNQKSRDQTDRKDKQHKDNSIFSEFSP